MYMLANLFYLIGVGLLERSPVSSQTMFAASGAGYMIAGLLGVSLDSAGYVLAISILWHILNCWVGIKRSFDREQTQVRLLRSWSTLVLINVVLYTVTVSDKSNLLVDIMGISGAALSVVVFANSIYRLAHAKIVKSTKALSDIPTVSLLIPARNEDHAMSGALDVALTIDYPKLEIIVLDDCSHDKTPEIIRRYAHEGVRFVQTKKLPEGWLGKNYAQTLLADEASGDVLLFCDVDIRLSPHSVSKIVSHMHHERIDMVSVEPMRLDFDVWQRLLMPLKTWWQLALPILRPGFSPVSHSCYAVTKKAYKRIGGHRSTPLHVMPEVTFARMLRKGSKYAYILSDGDLGVTTRKLLSSQEMTGLREQYLMTGATPGTTLVIALTVYMMAILPIYDVIIGDGILPGVITWLALGLSLTAVTARMWPRFSVLSILQLPILLIHEIVVLLLSMFLYESGKVFWKQRNICYPRLQVIPQLPRLK